MDPVFNETTGTSFATLSLAIVASAPNDVITLAPGAFVEDFPDIVHSLTIQCVEGMASLTRATPLTVDGRAILNVPGHLGVSLTVIGLEIFGAKRAGPDTNGAGILHEYGNGDLTIERCYIHGNENGILVGGVNEFSPPTGVNVLIRDSEFANNGAPVGSAYAAGGKCHNIYVNDVTTLTIEDSYIHSVFSQGSQIKSRAAVTTILNNIIEDLPQLTATSFGSSYSIDISNGGVAVIRGNVIDKGPYSKNKHFIQFGAEGQRYADNSLLVEDNDFINNRPDGATLLLNGINTAAIVGIPIIFRDNTFAGPYAYAGGIEIGGGSDDLMAGGTGADSLQGGLGNDTYIVNDAGDRVNEAVAAGNDTILTTHSAYTLGLNLEGLGFIGQGDFAGTGNTLANALTGGEGADTLNGLTGADTLTGGAGDDLYFVDNALDLVIETEGGGTDTVLLSVLTAYALAGTVENVIYTGTSSFRGTGNASANRIASGNGADTLDGGTGADTLDGGAGNDLYIVDDAGDVVLDSGGTIDTVRTTLLSYTLGAAIERLTFTGAGDFAATGNAAANLIIAGGGHDSLVGGLGNDSLSGLAGADTLDGGTGADSLAGGIGDDAFVVDNLLDRVVEAAGAGNDTVLTTLAAHTLAGNVEALAYLGTGNFAGTGNASANTLTSGEGADTLNGGTGADTLIGGAGNDTFILDNVLDAVIETAGGGTDTARTALGVQALAADVEHLSYTGLFNFRGTGNAADNRISSGNGADTLDGGEGADTLEGGAGNDLYIVDDVGDVVLDSAGVADIVQTTLAGYALAALPAIERLVLSNAGGAAGTGNALANRIAGGTGADTLDGGAGADTLTSGAGFDVFRFLAGEAGGELVTDFVGNGALDGDSLRFVGYGTAAEGATLTKIVGNDWRLVSADGLVTETIRLTGVTTLHASDYGFS